MYNNPPPVNFNLRICVILAVKKSIILCLPTYANRWRAKGGQAVECVLTIKKEEEARSKKFIFRRGDQAGGESRAAEAHPKDYSDGWNHAFW